MHVKPQLKYETVNSIFIIILSHINKIKQHITENEENLFFRENIPDVGSVLKFGQLQQVV